MCQMLTEHAEGITRLSVFLIAFAQIMISIGLLAILLAMWR